MMLGWKAWIWRHDGVREQEGRRKMGLSASGGRGWHCTVVEVQGIILVALFASLCNIISAEP
jgi:hypothetical protein